MDKICFVEAIRGTLKRIFLCDSKIGSYSNYHVKHTYYSVCGRIYTMHFLDVTCEECIKKYKIRVLFK